AGWYKMVITNNGFAPTEANVNADFSSASFGTDWSSYVAAAKGAGLQSVAPVFSPNVGGIPADGWADAQYSAIKTAALQGGALAVDTPSAFLLGQGSAYQTFTENEIQWAHQNHLRVTVILSPYDDPTTFGANSAAAVSLLSKAGTLPDDWAVENYATESTRIGSDTDPNSVAGVALWIAQNAPVYSTAAPTPTPTPNPTVVLGSGSDRLVLSVSEDAYRGDAQFTVAVDGHQVGGIQTATASHAAGQSQQFVVQGNFGGGTHVGTISFLNDAYGGSASTDRNLYVSGVSYDGVSNPNASGTLWTTGSASATVGAQDTLALRVSEDAYQGDAQFTVAVDGRQVGGTYAATASHAAGASQTIDLEGNWGPGSHAVAVTFVNDLYGGSAATDRNLYVTGASYDGTTQPVSFTEYDNGTRSFTVVSSSTTRTGAAGGMVATHGNDTVQAGTGAVTVSAGGASTTVLGDSGTLRFIASTGRDTVTGGTGNQTLTGGSGSLTYIAGHGNATIDAGSGPALFTIENGHAGGTLTITDFRAGLDTIHLSGYDAASAVRSQTVAAGATVIRLSDNTEIHLAGITPNGTSHLFS
ncbi:carbohydrate-binding domain-containing protein, partial [Jatrophihabitans endophyticus]|uniref:carbohydrate-binding domain-containing protein n=1 Tax=Jatrophihabitans endophyticus TaxID=1206085 RepID=UPI001A0D4781